MYIEKNGENAECGGGQISKAAYAQHNANTILNFILCKHCLEQDRHGDTGFLVTKVLFLLFPRPL